MELWNAGSLGIFPAHATTTTRAKIFTGGTSRQTISANYARVLIHKRQFPRAAMLADSFGITLISTNKDMALRLLHPTSRGVNPQVMLTLYAPLLAVTQNPTASLIAIDKAWKCPAAAPPLSSSHMDGVEV